ncbi:histidine kinase/DNA gyrase B/HSP90-like ATPase [Tamaricihabitans halophyticus]|uniref:Histidine kinase/DNA gyrase B/HSP90-like ATPase n=1 Tax=Tamaricihabitans halophyticus TaxID=1262583 RepID=A0A4R2R534_9PSEU|nr:histidine kinase [Tamaricihabitans halophyticus]TCP57137.1 histidine kinase/DNA gyrase B/HSP90-like ATPase [Tamaricihabitans halophyticus]
MDTTLATRALSASTAIANAALTVDDPGEVLELIVRKAAELAEADLGLVMASGADGQLTVEAAHGTAGAGAPEYAASNPVGLTLSARSSAARVARRGVPLVVQDFTSDPRTAPYVPKELRGYGPFAAAPFGTKDRRLGALTVYRRRGAAGFEPASVEVLTAFATQAALVQVLAEGATARRRIAVYEERERLARDLHDVLVQRLYAVGVQLDLLGRKLGGKLGRQDSARLADAVDQLDGTIAEVRDTVRALRDPDPGGQPSTSDLAASAHAEVDVAGELLGYAPSLKLSGGLANVPAESADHARAALRESLSNVVRHSGAAHTTVRIGSADGWLSLEVTDDGCGIPGGVTRRGLAHLEERATAAGGYCEVHTSARRGTRVLFRIPVA